MTKIELFREIYSLYEKGSRWLESIPNDIRDGYFDNTYVNCLNKEINLLMSKIYTESEIEDIEWFLYEWNDSHDLCATLNGVTYTFKDIDDYIEFLIKCGWEKH